ncbi:MAG: zeta toxin family protein [Verrucomicrobiota bacterium]
MFAGPNGSGKSTIKSVIPPSLLGVYINPDEIEDGIRLHGFVDLRAFNVETVEEEIFRFLAASPLLQKSGLCQEAQSLQFSDGRLIFQGMPVNSYFASVIADFLRQKLIEKRVSFTLETVMSSADKVRLLEKAQDLGYRTYIYYVATEDPIINISRVKSRVKIMGGHDVPEEKIVSRYYRSLALLPEAVRHSNRAYIFDNSNHEHIWLAEITKGKVLEIKTDHVPTWFQKAFLDHIPGK